MNCKKFEIDIFELARDPAAVVGEQAIVHLRSCPQCAAAVVDQRSLTSGLRALAWNTRGASAPAGVEANLRAAFHKSAAASKVVPISPSGATARYRLAFAAAAMVLLALAVSYYRHRSVSDPSGSVFAPQASTQESPSQGPGPLVSQGANPSSDTGPGQPHSTVGYTPSRAHHTSHKRENVARFESSDPETDFVPVAYGSDLTPLEGGQILRVRLSRSALASLGFPVSADQPDEPLLADVMLGEDGLARSVRLVDSQARAPKD